MRFRNALYVAMDNFSNVFKLLLYCIVTAIVFLGLAYTLLSLNLGPIIKSTEVQVLIELVNEFLLALTSGNTAYLQGFNTVFQEAIGDFWVMLTSHTAPIIWSVVGLVLLYLLMRFINGLAVCTVGSVLDDRMQIYSHTKFASAYFFDLGRSLAYEAIYVPLSFVYDALTIAACWFIFFYALAILPVMLSIALAVTAVVCMQALKYTFISSWMPAMICDKIKVGKAFLKSMTMHKNFSRRFASYLILIYLIIILNVIAAICTLGSMLLITISLSYILMLSLQFVHYYEDTGKKYFISYNKIENAGERPDVLGE